MNKLYNKFQQEKMLIQMKKMTFKEYLCMTEIFYITMLTYELLSNMRAQEFRIKTFHTPQFGRKRCPRIIVYHFQVAEVDWKIFGIAKNNRNKRMRQSEGNTPKYLGKERK